MTNEEAKVFLDNLKICIDEHPVVADWLVEIENRKTEPSNSEIPNNSTISKMEQVDKDINVRSKDEPRKEQNFCGKCRYLYRDFNYGLSCYRLMDNEPCKYEERKDEPQTERSE